ncbi:MAG TPA: hypothetical protein VE547_20620, partial [Mycobacteriales bacterium]|nr:hypothetical protein [Mycobacteriales bacterium]
TAVGVTFLLVSTGTAVSVAAVLLPFGATESARHFWYVAPLLPLILLGLHPRVVVGVLDMGLRRVGRPPVPSRMSYPGILRAAGWQLLSWLLLGLHAWVLALALGATASATTVAVAVGGFALGYGLGPLVVVTPAGAGVRETALVLTLGGVLGGSSAALAVALVSRLLLVVTEFGQAGVWTLLARRAGAPYAGPLSPAAGSSATAARAP